MAEFGVSCQQIENRNCDASGPPVTHGLIKAKPSVGGSSIVTPLS